MKKLFVLFAIAALVVMSLTACDFSGSLDVLKEDLNKLKDGFNGMVEDLEGAVDIDVVPCPNHSDNDSDHNCDLCLDPVTECKDESKDHKCDICNKAFSSCEDANSDHKCDLCSATLSECDDRNNDHYCNVCGRSLSVCADENNDHICDLCARILSKCADENSDHNCDVCGKELSVCVDENDDNVCDVCLNTICEHTDLDKNHKCDLCDKTLSVCADEGEDHVCDFCGECIHKYEQNFFWHPELVAATCCTPGVAVFECAYCDDYYTEATDIDPEAHAFWGSEEIISEANCQTETNGLKKVSCANGCGATEEVEIYYYTVHEWDVQKDTYPTCTEDGGYYAVCTLCGEVESYESPASGHYNWYFTCGDTCECMECGVTFTIEHDLTVNPATCTEAAYCINCWTYIGEPLGHKDEDGDYLCDNCGEDSLPENLERVKYELNVSDLEAGTLEADLIKGKFTIVSGSEIRNRTKTFEGIEYLRSVKIGNKTTKIKVSVPGNGKLSFLIQNGSSGAVTQFITVTGPDGTVYDLEFDGTNTGSPVVKLEIDVTEGEWIISRGKNGGTQDIFALSLICIVEKSNENGFEIVAEGKTDYLVGEKLDFSDLVANATFENGKTDVIAPSDLVIDTSAVDMTKSGTYEIKVSYKEYDAIIYKVNVYEPASVELGFDSIVGGTQTSAGNGTYVNNSFKESYKLGEELDLTGLSATVVATLGDSSRKFLVETVEVTGFDSETAGAKVLKVNYEYLEGKSVYAEVTVYVTDAAYSIVDEVYQVKVEKSYDGAIGAIVDGYNMFTTIQQALDFLAGAEANAKKLLLIGEGLFTEKLEITIPSLTIKGAGKNKTTIEWDSLYGLKDASGYANVTDSTQTVAVREEARGCVIEDITISNYWNTQERMDEAGLEIERGLALLVQADMFIMRDSKLLGIQDTLELFTGRQYFENVYISGYTDFIFGTNNTTYFKNCTVHVVDTVKDDKGTAGYLTAFKGSNKGAQDAITYGAIFDGCKFTADEGVTAGKTAIGRTWGAYAAVAIINSELGGHISLDGYDSANNKNKRYISMNGIHPTDETVQFVEYNNTGAGAVTEAVAGMTMLTADEAAVYADFAVIFGTTNRNVSYLDPWDPTSGEVAADDRTYYYFTEEIGTSGTSYNVDTTLSLAAGETYELGDLVVDAGTGKAAWNANSGKLNMKAGASIKFSVKAGSTVTVVTHSGYGYYTINGVATSHSTTFTKYFAEDTDVVILSTGDLYIASVVINPDEEAPEAPTLDKIVVSGINTNYTVGTAPSFEGIEVKAHYSDNSVVAVTDYTVDSSAVNSDAEGSYDVSISYGGETVTVTLVYEDPDASVEITKDTYLDFSTEAGYEAVQNNKRVTMDGSFRFNGAEYQITGTIKFPVKAGTLVTVTPYNNSNYVSYTIGMEGETNLATNNVEVVYMVEEDGVVVYTGLDNNYLVGISIECPIAEGKYVFGGSTVEGDVTGILSSVQGLTIEGTCKTHSGGAQLSNDSGIFFTLPASATVTIKGFDTSYGQLEVYVGEDLIEMNSDACYVFTTVEATLVKIYAVNVGTEEAPAWNKSYITYIDVVISEEPETPAGPVIVDIGALEEGTTTGDELVAGSGVSASAGLTIDGNNKTYEDLSFTKRLKLGGTMKVSDGVVTKGLEVVTTGAAKITVYAISSSSSSTRTLQIATLADGVLNQLSVSRDIPGDAVAKAEFTVDAAGTYYIGSTKDGINVYYIEVAPVTSEPETPDEPESKTYTVNFSDFEEFAKGTYTDGQVQEYDDVFTFYHGADSRVDGNSKTFEDEFAGTKRFGFGGKFKKIDGAAGRALEINATGAGTVTIWWVSGGDGRSVDLLGSDFSTIATTGTDTIAKDGLYITTFEIPAAGVYYLTNAVNNNYWFKVEVTIG